MSTNLAEPFFCAPTDPKEYLHSFSDSIINFGPGLTPEVNVLNGPVAGLNGSHHLGSHHMTGGHSALSDIFKCEDGHFEDFHSDHHTLCSPCLIDGKLAINN